MKAPLLKINIIVITILFTVNSYSQIVLNELMVRPPGTVATPPNGLIYNSSQEYIEIYNSGCSQVNISGYFIAMKQSLTGTNTGGTYKIPNVPAAILDPGEHVVIGSANPGGTVVGNIDIPMAAADYCIYNGNYVLANTDGWCALYNASGVAIDCVYWSSSASNLTSNTSDFNPGALCLPTGSPAVTLQTPFQINSSNPSILRYGGTNPSAGSPLSRQQDGSNTWVQNLASSIAVNNCNGGTCVTPSSAPSAPSVTTPVNYCQGATAIPLIATPIAGGTLNWYGTNATGGTASPTAPIPSTATVGSTTYYVSQTVAGCEGPRAPIVVIITSGGNLGLFCDTANSTPTSLAFDFSNVGQTNFSISYSINGGAPINVTHTSPSNYTVAGLTAGDSVTFTLTANGVSCVQPQTVTCSTASADCGSCSAPTCPIIGVANYGVRNFSAGSCSSWSPALTNTVVKNYYLVQADANGFVGLIQQANGSPALCISRSAALRPFATSCNVASNVSPSVVNANGVASGFNPEWYGLTPNAQYIIEVTITLGVGCTLDSLCSNYYGCTIPSAPTASATIQPTCTIPTGTIVVSSPTGVGNLYSIDGINFQASPTFSGLAPNTYTVIVKKTPSGCTSSATNITINAVPTIIAPTASATAQPTCTVGTGTIVVSSPIGANFEYSINGTTFQTSPTFSGLTPNTYNVIVKNLTTGCISIATIVTINSQPATPNVPTISSVAATCSAAGSSSISNYVAGITYVFNPAGPIVSGTGAISGMINGTSYSVTASNGSCTSSASASFSNVAQLTVPATPTILSVAPTCSSSGSSNISNYVTGITYVFNPAGPSVVVGGAISGMVTGTNYTVSASNGSCISSASASFSNVAQLTVPATPTILSVAPTCSSSGSSSISNYVTGITYVFNPAGPSVVVGGAISGMVTGTNYTVSASNGSCTSSASASFSNVAQLTVPATPTILSVAPTCSSSGSSSISNYVTGITYVFNPAGPTVAVGGAISGMVSGTNYTVSASNGSCISSASASFSNVAQLTVPATPTILSVAPTCLASGSSSISNYVAGITYVFNPAGPSVAVGGAISGMVTGTNYTVSASNGSCTSSASASFSNAAQLTVPATPTILSVAPTCLASGSSSISNYVAGITYVFNPAGPSVAVGGAISGMVTGTNYTVSASNGSCTSSVSASFSNVVQLTVPATPTILSVAPTCSSSGSSSISNYVAGITYVFNPSGPSVAAGGAISGMVTGTNYTVSASNGSCSSVASANIVINAQPVTPVLNYTVTNTVCNGNTLNFVLNSNVTNTNFSWSATVSNISGFYSTTTNGDESNINNLVALTNPEAIGTITMVIIPRANGCDGIPQTVIITVNPNPVVEVVAVADTSVCSATSATNNVQVNISGNISGITYNWTAITNGVTVVGGTTSGTITATSTTASFGLQVITSNPLVAGTIYFEVSSVRNGCPGNTLQSGVVTVNPNPGLPIPSPIKTICSGEDTDLIVDVSPLIAGTELTWEVLTVVNVSGATPGTGIAPVTINDALTATTNAQGYVIYRVRSSLGECQGGYTDYRVNVNPAPLPVLIDGNICITATGEVYQTYTLNTGLNDADYDFEWFDTNGDIIPGATSSTLVVDEAGTYSVIATNWLTGCSSDPLLASATATVTETLPATSMTVIQSEYFSDNATITVNVTGGSGTLMYSLDEGPLQSSNVFTGVSAGEHLVTVIDTEGCTFMTQKVNIIDYPNYFTPNGDGINDTWNISGLNQADAKLYIFDRYGKLIKQLSATDDSEGWDGTYNQELLPSTDYWFSLDYMENGVAKTFKAHFTMKR
ncbi:T9SS type B sorting domain-containing protein [Flavobacterium helocola]|uniref:T9SS type B sorting domain-containing protein n=1 Tax=Flavobacterium helocola TaxID=3139139 RepID=A0ABU9I7A3_9FLAO